MTATQTLPIDRAEAYRAAAWCNPIGIPFRRKSPPEDGFTGESGRFSTPEDIARWRDEGKTNLAGRLMKSVIGIDKDFYKEGTRETFAARVAEFGALPPTWEITSRDDGSGIGLYRVSAGLSWPGQVCPNVELIQFRHRYVVLPGSVHPEGRIYRAVKPDGTSAELDEIPRLTDLPYLPDAWAEALTGVRPGGEKVKGHRAPGSRAEQHQGRRKARQWIRSLPSGKPCRYVGELAADAMAAARREEGAAYDHTRDTVMALLRAGEVGHPGVQDILTKVRDTYVETVEDRADDAVAAAEFNRFTYAGVAKILADPSKRKGSGCDCVQDARTTIPETGDDRPDATLDPEKYVPLDWAAVWAAPREADWLVEPFIPRGRGTALYAPAGKGKSLLALNVAARLACGQRVLDRPAGEPVSVVYIDLEMTEDDVLERLSDMGYSPDSDLSHFHYYLLPSLPPLDTEEGGLDLLGIVERHDAALVVIDTTSRVISGKENDSDTFRDLYANTGRLLKMRGTALVRLDHAGKDPERGQRGSSAKSDDVDLVWELGATDSGVSLRAKKRRQTWIPERVDLVLLEEPVRFERATESYQAGTAEVAALLDSHDVPLNASGVEAIKTLKGHNQGRRNQLVREALRYRREQASGPGTPPGTPPAAISGTVNGNTPAIRFGNTPRNTPEHPSAVNRNTPPSQERGGVPTPEQGNNFDTQAADLEWEGLEND